MADERSPVRKPAVAERHTALGRRVSPVAATAGPVPAARLVHQRLGNRGTQAFAAQVIARSSAPVVASTATAPLQASLTISQPGDPYEREADRVADVVMRMPAAHSEVPDISAVSSTLPAVRRACAECKTESEPEASGQMRAHRMADPGSAPGITPAVEANVRTLQGQGSPLPRATREFFEPRFGADFSQVRVNTGPRAEETARSLGARAFTVGSSISFAAGQFAATSPEGQRLLAHELTHVVQQDGAVRRSRAPVQRKEAEPRESATGRTNLDISKSTEGPRQQPAWYNVGIPFTDYQFDPSWSGVKTAAGVVKDAAVDALEAIANEIRSLVNSARDWLIEKWEELKGIANAAWNGAKAAFTNIISLFKNPLGFLVDAIMGLDADSLDRGWTKFLGVVNSIANGFKAMADNILGTANTFWRIIDRFATGVLDRVSSLTSSFLFRKLPDIVQKGVTALVNTLKSVWKGISDGWTALVKEVKGWVDSAIDAVLGFVLKVVGFGINTVISGIVLFGQLVLFLKDLFTNPRKYVDLLAKRTVQAFDGVEGHFAGVVGQYFGGTKAPAKPAAANIRGPAANVTVSRAPAPAGEKKGSATNAEIGSGVLEMMGKKWDAFKSNPMSVVIQLLKDLIFPMAGNIDDIIQLFKDIRDIVTGPFSAGSLDELWTSVLRILDIPILIYHTVVSILMRTLMLPLIVASFIPHPVVKGIAAVVGYALLGAFVQSELLNIGHKLVLLKTGATTGDQKKEAYNRIADSLIALAMTAAIMLLMLLLHFLASVAKGIYNFVKGKVFGVEPVPVEGKGSAQGEGKGAEGKGAKEGIPSKDGKRKIKINEGGKCEVCASPCAEIRKKYANVMTPEAEAKIKVIENDASLSDVQKIEKLKPIEQELAQKALTSTPGKLIGDLTELSADEVKFVQEQVAQGRTVEIIPRGPGRTPDFKIDGTLRELKTLSGVADASADNISKAIANRVMNGRGQATDIIVDARGQAGITEAIAERGIRRAYGADNVTGGKITSIRVIGPNFDVTIPRK